MAKALRTVALIAGAVALVATGVGLAIGAAGVIAGVSGATLATIGAIAGVVSGVASLGAQLTAKTPPARGSITQVLVASDPPQPYLMGESYFGGVLRHDTGYGATLKKVPNPYRGMVIDYSGGGPLEQLVELQTDFAAVSGYFSGFLATDTQLGATPESTALVPPLSAPMPGWDAASKLSGQAAVLWNFKFDKDGKRFASGLPVVGAIWKGVKAYDPRLDTTYPGGAGAQRIDDEATWGYSDNPALHALAYAYGRYQNGVQTFGIGVPATALRLAEFVTLANVCEANSWRLSGIVYEPGDRWNNLKDILAAGGAEPVFAGGTLGVRIRTPTVALDTITEADLADESASVTSMQSYRDRLNAVIPKYRSPDHNWELVAADAVRVTAYETEDGEEKIEEIAYNLVRDVDQAAQLARYRLEDGRELGPIRLPCLPRLRAYRPGECLALDIPSLGLDTDAIILTRQIDPATMKVTLTLVGETPAKHAFALGITGTPPPTPALGQTAAERDEISTLAGEPIGFTSALIANSYVTDADPLDGLIQATDTAITVETHTRTYSDKTVSVIGAVITTEDDGVTALVPTTTYHIYYDDGGRQGGAVTFKATQDPSVAANTPSNEGRHYLGSIPTDVVAGSGVSEGGQLPPGWRQEYWYL